MTYFDDLFQATGDAVNVAVQAIVDKALADVRSELSATRAILQDTELKLSDCASHSAQLERDNTVLTGDNETLKNMLAGAKTQITELLAEIDRLNARIAELEAQETEYRVAKKQPFTSNGWPNIALGAGAILEKPTDTKTAAFRKFAKGTINKDRWSYPRYFANAATQIINLIEVKYIGGPATGNNWMISLQPDAEPGGGTDLPIIAWQPDERYFFEIYKATWNSTRTGMSSSSVRKVDSWSDGYVPGAQAGQIPAHAGLILADELVNNQIDHNIMIGVPDELLKAGYVFPARGQDSNAATAYSGPLPMGSLLAIPAARKIADIGLATSQGEALARALQGRGGTIKVRSSTICLFVEAYTDVDDIVKALIPDWVKLIQELVVVTNSTKENPGGPGERIVPAVLPLESEVS